MSFPLLERAHESRKREKEQLRKSVLKRTWNLLEELSAEYSFETAYLFGSVTRPGQFKTDSDVDVAFEGLDERDTEKMTAKLSFSLERPVNVVHLGQVHFAPKIRQEGIQWTKK